MQNGMKSSVMKYLSVSTPHTYNMNKIHVPPKVLMPPVLHPPKWKKASVTEGGFASNLQDSQDSDSESLAEEGQYQLEFQQRILESEEVVRLCSVELENDGVEEDSLEEMSLEEEGSEYDTSANGTQKSGGSGGKQQSMDKYSSLRYNPNWKKTQMAAEFLGAEQASQIAGGSSVDFSQDSFYLHSSGSSEEKHQQEIKTQVSFSEFDSELLSFHEPNILVSNEPVGLQTKKKESADGCHSTGSAGTCAFPLQNQQDRPQRAKKNFVKKNKQTLGLPSERINSYLELHNKKVLQEQVTDPKTADEEKPLQGVPPSQTAQMKPEDNQCLKGQQLKDQHNNFSQRNKPKPNESLKGRDFPRNDSQEPPGGPAERKSYHQSHQQIPGFLAATSAVEQGKSTALQECLHPNPSVGPDADPARKSNTCLNNFPISRHFVKQHFTTFTYPFPTLHHFNPAEVVSPAYTSTENKKYQQDSPSGISPEQQHLHTYVPGHHCATADRTNGQAHPKQRNVPSTFNANFQELVKDQVPLQDSKKHVPEDKRPPQSFAHSSPTAPCAASQFREMMEQHHPRIPGLAGAHFADRWLLSLLPPAIPQVQSGSEGNPEGGEGNPGQISRSNSDGYLTQMKKQTHPKVNKKPCSRKVYVNLNVKLGGLGPDYEAIKEKKEKLKLQKEYSRQIKEYNKKNITIFQRLPTKPQVTSSVSRQKALEYAKKIPRPKTFITRQSDKEVKEEGVVPQTSNGTSLPKIPSLETLRSRHEKEKEVVAAFQALHIL